MGYHYFTPDDPGWHPSRKARRLARLLTELPAEDVANALWLVDADLRTFVRRIVSRLPRSVRIERACRAGGRAMVAKYGRAHLRRLLAVGRATRWRQHA